MSVFSIVSIAAFVVICVIIFALILAISSHLALRLMARRKREANLHEKTLLNFEDWLMYIMLNIFFVGAVLLCFILGMKIAVFFLAL